MKQYLKIVSIFLALVNIAISQIGASVKNDIDRLSEETISDVEEAPRDAESIDKLPKSYVNINNFDGFESSSSVTDDLFSAAANTTGQVFPAIAPPEKQFHAAPYINVNGGWGQQTNMAKGGGTFTASLGYRFVESFALEFTYQLFDVSIYNTTQVNNYFSAAPKVYYVLNPYVTFYAASAVGIGYTNINNISNNANAPESYLKTNNQISGFVALPVGVMFPVKYVDNLSLRVDYLYTLSFNGASQNFVTSGLQYAF